MLLKACLNGGRSKADHAEVPVTPAELARDAAAVVEAGAGAIHVHPRGADGIESLAAADVDAAVAAIREAVPGVPLGVTTAAWIEPELPARLRLIGAWTELPDFASVNLSEDGSPEIVRALLARGIGVEAGFFQIEDVARLVASDLAPRCVRTLVEPIEPDAGAAVSTAAAIDAALDTQGIDLPRVHHGLGPATWAVIRAALDRGRDVRIGLEDTFTLPDGRAARDNADLVAAAHALLRERER